MRLEYLIDYIKSTNFDYMSSIANNVEGFFPCLWSLLQEIFDWEFFSFLFASLRLRDFAGNLIFREAAKTQS